jgi:hypothetical protein
VFAWSWGEDAGGIFVGKGFMKPNKILESSPHFSFRCRKRLERGLFLVGKKGGNTILGFDGDPYMCKGLLYRCGYKVRNKCTGAFAVLLRFRNSDFYVAKGG